MDHARIRVRLTGRIHLFVLDRGDSLQENMKQANAFRSIGRATNGAWGLRILLVALCVIPMLVTTGCRTRQSLEPTSTQVAGVGHDSIPTVNVHGKKADSLLVPDPTLIAQVLSSVGVVAIEATSVNGNSGDFDLDLFVVDTAGQPVTGLSTGSFSIPTSGAGFSLTGLSTLSSSSFGPFSAEVLIDQTGSMRDTDPLNLRLTAANIFLSLLDADDEVQLSTFAGDRGDPYNHKSYGEFTNNGKSLIPAVNSLAYSVMGNTPLYDAMYWETDSLVALAKNSNKALIVLTDGQDNQSTNTINSAISHALQSHVRVFAAALKTGLNLPLINAAMTTGGTVMHADDPKQIVSYYGALGKIVRGQAKYYRTKWHTTNPFGLSGQTINSSMIVKGAGSSMVNVPFSVTFP